MDKTTELSRVIAQEGNLSAEMLDEYAREQRLTGILVLDQNHEGDRTDCEGWRCNAIVAEADRK